MGLAQLIGEARRLGERDKFGRRIMSGADGASGANASKPTTTPLFTSHSGWNMETGVGALKEDLTQLGLQVQLVLVMHAQGFAEHAGAEPLHREASSASRNRLSTLPAPLAMPILPCT